LAAVRSEWKVELICRIENKDDEIEKLIGFIFCLWRTHEHCKRKESKQMTGEDVMCKEARVTFVSEEAKGLELIEQHPYVP
jgi:hypothetical protein